MQFVPFFDYWGFGRGGIAWLNTNNVPLRARTCPVHSFCSWCRSSFWMQLCNSVFSKRFCHFDPLYTTWPWTMPIMEPFGSGIGKIYNRPCGSCLIQSKPVIAIIVDAAWSHVVLILFSWLFLCWDTCKRRSVQGFLILPCINAAYDKAYTNGICHWYCQVEQALHESLKQ